MPEASVVAAMTAIIRFDLNPYPLNLGWIGLKY